ncbi:hypothetical protein IM793_23020 [Pedobacter sp. MR2016-19]|uniref:hypothetical protein n=1 Tax=Pedobacter sp. MR2016-19 TaxID=2780089 RepID=UPI0018763070|nr:hypothetical protein [Pedobacter sp. MR2016-19]MBE5322046.1 hypothetical protein [Pedobacter sp. MR2016-19]
MNNPALDVVIGIVFVYLLYSLLATVLQEMLAKVFDLRAKMLKTGIKRMLGTKSGKNEFVGKFYSHPSIKYLAQGNGMLWNKPSYLSSNTFSQTLIYLLRGDDWSRTSNQADAIEKKIKTGLAAYAQNPQPGGNPSQPSKASGSNFLKKSPQKDKQAEPFDICSDALIHLNNLFQDAGGDLGKFNFYLERWYNDTMERVSGWYRRQTQLWLLAIGTLIAIAGNIDTLKIYRILSTDTTARKLMVEMAIKKSEAYTAIVNQPPTDRGAIPSEGKETMPADSAFIKTYQMLQKDADRTKGILGLGWIDEKGSNSRDSLAKLIAASEALLQAGVTRQTKLAKDLQKNDLLAQQKFKKAIMALKIDSLNSRIQTLNQVKKSINTYLTFHFWPSIAGWLLTAIAISFGAPFWFDLLNKLINIRATGEKPQEIPKSESIPTRETLGQEKIKVTEIAG